MSTGATSGVRRIVIYGKRTLSNETMRMLVEGGCEVTTIPVVDIVITGTCGTGMLLDDIDRRYLVPIEPPKPVTQLAYGPQRKGKGGKIRRW